MTQLHKSTVGNTPGHGGGSPAPTTSHASPLRHVGYSAGAAALSPRGGDPLLRLGSQGASVSRLQRLLAQHDDSPGAVDGIFGPQTQRAVERFQRQNHLEVDGVVGPVTWGALERSGGGGGAAPAQGGAQPAKASAGMVRLGCSGAQVELLQRRLEAQGFDVGAVDGDFGAKTLQATKAFQRKHGLEDDGIVGKQTWHSLGVSFDPSLTKLPSGGGAPSGGGGQHHLPPGSSSGDPVALARSFCYQPPAASHDMRGVIPNFTAAGGWTNNCADFVSAILETCGRIRGHHINVVEFEGALQAQGWHQVSMAKAQPGDVWINHSRGHTQLVATKGASSTIGSNNDRPGHQVINEKAGYDAVIYHRDFK